MATIRVKASYLLRKDTSANWNSKNPVLGNGEIALATDTGVIKIGDGERSYNSLGSGNTYYPGSGGVPTGDWTTKSYVDTADALKMNKSAFDYNETTKTLTIDIS